MEGVWNLPWNYIFASRNPDCMLDLDEYPDGTEEILVALLERKQAHDEYHKTMMKRLLLASQCPSLNKEQVRYRAELLAKDNHVSINKETEHNQQVTYYGLHRSGEEAAKAIAETKDILGDIPEQVEKDDLLELVSEIKQLRSDVRGSKEEKLMKVQIDGLMDRVERLEEEVGIIEDS